MKLIRILSSVRFAVSMLIIVAVAAAVSTFFGWEGFFRSPYFLAPAALFALSLLTCTAESLVRRPRRRLTGYAHDIIHIGVLLLLMGGTLTLLASREETVTLDIGESVTVREHWEVMLVDSTRTVDNWISTLQIQREGEAPRVAELSVNNPVKAGPVRLLQQTWANPRVLILQDQGGGQYIMAPGEGFASGNTVIILEETDETDLGLRFARFEDSRRTGTIQVEEGMTIAELTVVGSEQRIQSGIQVVHDPGAPVALAGAIVLMAGLLLYLYRRVREEG